MNMPGMRWALGNVSFSPCFQNSPLRSFHMTLLRRLPEFILLAAPRTDWFELPALLPRGCSKGLSLQHLLAAELHT